MALSQALTRLGILASAVTLLAPAVTLASEQHLDFKFVVHPLDVKVVEAPNIAGQTLSAGKWFGVAVFSDGRIAVIRNSRRAAYGYDQRLFSLAMNKLPPSRAKRCKLEYEDLEFAMRTTFGPHIDNEKARRVLALRWFVLDANVIASTTNGH